MELDNIFVTHVVLTLEEAFCIVTISLGKRDVYIGLLELGVEGAFFVV